MKTPSKKRRSERLPAAVRLLLTIPGPGGAVALKEVVTTVEVSQYGARLLGRRLLEVGSQGVLIQLSSGRQTPFQVAWQAKSPARPGYLNTGIELLPNLHYWDRAFSPAPEPSPTEIAIDAEAVSAEELVRALAPESSPQQDWHSEPLLEVLWCGLVDQLAERKVITRAELAASLRKIA